MRDYLCSTLHKGLLHPTPTGPPVRVWLLLLLLLLFTL